MKINILADQNIPLLDYFFADNADVQTLPAALITADHLRNIDVLLTRSHTRVNEALLAGTAVQFVGSCVSGIDHVDAQYLAQNHIAWYGAKGCNALAVVQYVAQVLKFLSEPQHPPAGVKQAQAKKAAVVGVGHVGKRIVALLQRKGFDVLQCDPLRAAAEGDFLHTPLAQLTDIDLLCLHTPLTYHHAGVDDFPTYHMINRDFLCQLNSKCTIINAGRGDVIDPQAIKQFADQFTWALDVWPNEPEIDISLIDIVQFATPHIAGATVAGRWLGTKMVYAAMAKRFHWPTKELPSLPIDQPHEQLLACAQQFKQRVLQAPDEKVAEIFLHTRREYTKDD